MPPLWTYANMQMFILKPTAHGPEPINTNTHAHTYTPEHIQTHT